MAELFKDESIYLRLQQLQKGLIQFTDTTNAYRMLTEHGKDIRYCPAHAELAVLDQS